MTAFDEISLKERRDLPMSKLETALFTLWGDFNGYEKMATEAAEQLASLVEENKKLREALTEAESSLTRIHNTHPSHIACTVTSCSSKATIAKLRAALATGEKQ